MRATTGVILLLAVLVACQVGGINKKTTGGTTGTAGTTTGGATTTSSTTGGTTTTTGGTTTTTTGGTTTTTTTTTGGTGTGSTGGSGTSSTTGMRFDVVIITQYSTCIIGDPCLSGTCATSVVTGSTKWAANSNLRIVAPGDPNIAAANQSLCLTPTMSQADQNAVVAALNGNFLNQVATDTNNSLPMQFNVHYVTFAGPSSGLPMTAAGPGVGWYFSATDVNALIAPSLAKESSFVLVTANLRDDALGMEIVPLCSTTQTGDAIAGSGYTWVAKTADGFASDCFTLTNVMFGWEQQLAWGINHISGFSSAYPTGYPPGSCHNGANPNTWFPTPNDCILDPDWSDCGAGSCSSIDAFDDHILSAHWVRGRPAITNHCQDHQQDYGETGVDSGGDCPAN